jgi:hypothetical protein
MDYSKYTFNDEKYSKYHTEYPKEFIDYLYVNVGLNKNSIVTDIGSGTGKLSCLTWNNQPDAGGSTSEQAISGRELRCYYR